MKSNKKLEKKRSISPRKIVGELTKEETRLYKSLEKLSSIHVRNQKAGNPEYIQAIQRINRQLGILKRASNVSVIKKQWIHKKFT